MFGLGTQEIIIILAVALLIFGPKKLPEIGKSIGSGLREIKRASRDVMDTLETDEEPVKEMEQDASDSDRIRN